VNITLDPTVRVRFAPSPTGSLHIGSARTALYNYLFARHHGGVFVVRIEDTDVERSEARHEETILDDLAWLLADGDTLPWDEGPRAAGGTFGPYRQSERLALYREAAEGLLEQGKAYRCFCSDERLAQLRATQLAAGKTPRYDRWCHSLSVDEVNSRMAAGERAAIRLLVPAGELAFDDAVRGPMAFSSDVIGDFVIVRSNGSASYNFAAAFDDTAMQISHVIRGDDHMTNTARQLVVLAALGARAPRYAHHSLILGPDGSKLSKRHGATSVGEYRGAGYLAAAIRNYLSLLSWSHEEREILASDELIADLDLGKLSSSPAIFDRAKLDWLDHQWIMRSSDDEHAAEVARRLPAGTAAETAQALAAALKPSIASYGEVATSATPILDRPRLTGESAQLVLATEESLRGAQSLRAAQPADYLTPDDARELLAEYRRLGAERGLKARELLMPLRIALTGEQHGIELHFVLAALSRAETLARLDSALAAATDSGPTASGRSGPHQES
jgi:nondiscriminating glutamyl-tRNA synthetase